MTPDPAPVFDALTQFRFPDPDDAAMWESVQRERSEDQCWRAAWHMRRRARLLNSELHGAAHKALLRAMGCLRAIDFFPEWIWGPDIPRAANEIRRMAKRATGIY